MNTAGNGAGIGVVCVQTESNRDPRSAELQALKDFPIPLGCKKKVHIWCDRKGGPRIIEL